MKTNKKFQVISKTVEAAVLQVEPEQAKEWLEYHNIENRDLTSSKLRELKRVLRNKEYALTGDAICFDKEGFLLNGQHRLKAMVETGISIPLIVVIGLDRKAFRVMDQGLKRSLADMLKLDGYHNYTYLATALRYFWIFRCKNVLGRSKEKLTIPYAYDLLLKHRTLPDRVDHYLANFPDLRKSLSASGMLLGCIMTTELCHTTSISKTSVRTFWEEVLAGTSARYNLTQVLRRKLIADKSARRDKKLTRDYWMCYLVKCWNNYYESGDVLTQPRIKAEDYENGLVYCSTEEGVV